MKKYKFLFKPLFFILCLLFASWLVIKIEKISPSDFGKYRSLFENEEPKPKKHAECKGKECILGNKDELKKICGEFNYGLTDSLAFDKKLEEFMEKFHAIHTADKKP
jgi:hypothetical protein